MTIGELGRAIESKKRIKKDQLKEKAFLDYTLAALIARNISKIFNSDNEVITINEAYPDIFRDEIEDIKRIEEAKQTQKDQLSILRFRLFAQSYNNRHYKEVGE